MCLQFSFFFVHSSLENVHQQRPQARVRKRAARDFPSLSQRGAARTRPLLESAPAQRETPKSRAIFASPVSSRRRGLRAVAPSSPWFLSGWCSRLCRRKAAFSSPSSRHAALTPSTYAAAKKGENRRTCFHSVLLSFFANFPTHLVRRSLMRENNNACLLASTPRPTFAASSSRIPEHPRGLGPLGGLTAFFSVQTDRKRVKGIAELRSGDLPPLTRPGVFCVKEI